jgi:hypothetical protein
MDAILVTQDLMAFFSNGYNYLIISLRTYRYVISVCNMYGTHSIRVMVMLWYFHTNCST